MQDPLLLNCVTPSRSPTAAEGSAQRGVKRDVLYTLPIGGLWCDECDAPSHGLPEPLRVLAQEEEILIKSIRQAVKRFGLGGMQWNLLWCAECDGPAHGLPIAIRDELQRASESVKRSKQLLASHGSMRSVPIAKKRQSLAASVGPDALAFINKGWVDSQRKPPDVLAGTPLVRSPEMDSLRRRRSVERTAGGFARVPSAVKEVREKSAAVSPANGMRPARPHQQQQQRSQLALETRLAQLASSSPPLLDPALHPLSAQIYAKGAEGAEEVRTPPGPSESDLLLADLLDSPTPRRANGGRDHFATQHSPVAGSRIPVALLSSNLLGGGTFAHGEHGDLTPTFRCSPMSRDTPSPSIRQPLLAHQAPRSDLLDDL